MKPTNTNHKSGVKWRYSHDYGKRLWQCHVYGRLTLIGLCKSFVMLQVILCSACSGHGYKFASVLGEILADLATTGATQHDIALHRIRENRKGMDVFLSRFACSPKARL